MKKYVEEFFRNENLEPRFYWGLRMGIVAVVPIIWGWLNNRLADAEHISFAAECLCWLEMKGSLSQRLRLLVAGIGILIAATCLGGLAGSSTMLSVIGMLGIGFFAGLFKNLGDRGSGLAFVLNVFFIMSLAFPFASSAEMQARIWYTIIGGLLTLSVSFAATLLHPTNFPYRRSIAAVWQAVSDMTVVIMQGWDGKTVRSSMRKLYGQEMHLRKELDSSMHFFEGIAADTKRSEEQKFALSRIRKAASLVGTHVMSIADELQHVNIKEVQSDLRIEIYSLLRTITDICQRMKDLMLEIRDEDILLFDSRMTRMEALMASLKDSEHLARDKAALNRILHLGVRLHRLFAYSKEMLGVLRKDQPSFKSYSLVKTMFILHPKYLLRNIKMLINFNTFTTRYALRLAVAMALAVLIWKLMELPYGYWLPFTVAILIQPYFGATFKKAIDRTLGTILGAVVGGLIMYIPDDIWLEIVLLFICSVYMVYYVRNKYSYAAFFMTLSLMLLFEMNKNITPLMLIDRTTMTAAGSVLAIVMGYAFLPAWDKKYLPQYITEAITANFLYFIHTYYQFQPDKEWVRFKQMSETANANAFDSYSRYTQEPVLGQKQTKLFYQLLSENIRITHELNNQHLQHADTQMATMNDDGNRIALAFETFREILKDLSKMEGAKLDKLKMIDTSHWENMSPITSFTGYYLEKLNIELRMMQNDLQQWKQAIKK